jgi:radical SAM superfamily enzyme YgiQ (UPF0313 family)
VSDPTIFPRAMSPPKHVLFINPWVFDFTAYDFWMKPLGLLRIAAIVEKYTAAGVSLIDCLDRFFPGMPAKMKRRADGRGPFYKEEVSKPDVLRPVPRRFSRYGLPVSLVEEELGRIPRPDLVMLSCSMTYWYPGVQLAVDLVKRRFGRNVPVVLGGVYATLCPEHARSESGADIILSGPGENLVLPLIREMFGDASAARVEFNSLADLPDPAFHLLPSTEILAVSTSRGCPNSCSYCAGCLLFPGFEQLPHRRAVELIRTLPERFGTRHLAFYDDALLVNKARHFLPILAGMRETAGMMAVHLPNGLSVRGIDRATARLLRSAGVRSIFLSQESMDDGWLRDTGSEKVSPRDLASALAHLEKAGYRRSEISVYLLVGLPGQGTDAIRESIVRVKELGARATLAYFSAVPGTREWSKLIRKGLLRDDSDPLLHNKLASPYIFGTIPPEDLLSLKSLSLPGSST